jgi:hypothetical protein
VSRICEGLDERVEAFRTRTPGHTAFPYVYLDATSINVRDDALGQVVSRAVVIATGITATGARDVLSSRVALARAACRGVVMTGRGREVAVPPPAWRMDCGRKASTAGRSFIERCGMDEVDEREITYERRHGGVGLVLHLDGEELGNGDLHPEPGMGLE